MIHKRIFPVLLAFSLAASLMGCMPKQTMPQQPQGYTITPQNVVQTPAMLKTVPSQLTTLNSNAIGIYDDAMANNWSGINTRLKAIRSDYVQLKPMLESAGVAQNLVNNISGSIDDLEKQAASKKLYETKLYANKITKYLPDAQDSFNAGDSTSLHRIGYLLRESNLNAEKRDWTAAKSNSDSAGTIWNGMSSALKQASKSTSSKFTTDIGNLDKAIKAKNSTEVAKYTKLLSSQLTTLNTDFAKGTAK